MKHPVLRLQVSRCLVSLFVCFLIVAGVCRIPGCPPVKSWFELSFQRAWSRPSNSPASALINGPILNLPTSFYSVRVRAGERTRHAEISGNNWIKQNDVHRREGAPLRQLLFPSVNLISSHVLLACPSQCFFNDQRISGEATSST